MHLGSSILIGKVTHDRLSPVRHRFVYPLYWYALDLDDLERLDRECLWFGYNRRRIVAIHDSDYLKRSDKPIGVKVREYLDRTGVGSRVKRIVLITEPRIFNYVFNPVSFYLAYDDRERIITLVAEVNNTFGERHPYVLTNGETTASGQLRFLAPKEFHVSPFYPVRGVYEFLLSVNRERFDLRINLLNEGTILFRSGIHAVATPLSGRTAMWAVLTHPFATLLTMPRILYQAARLYWHRKLPVFTKPPPRSEDTLVITPRWRERLAFRLVVSFLKRLKRGRLLLILPDGRELYFGAVAEGIEAHAEPQAVVRVHSFQMFVDIVARGDIGFGEAYTAGSWSSPDLIQVLALFIRNIDLWEEYNIPLSAFFRSFDRLAHVFRRNSIAGSRKNIRAHYDLSNDFFAQFLDPSMVYSCALFRNEGESLEEAQENKIQALIEKAQLTATHHLLEIGCGWGTFAIEAARRTGCRVTGVTISKEQFRLAAERVRAAGLSDRVSIELCDYREIQGEFDRIVSIEMLEAVGHEYLGCFFSACERLLKPDGVIVLQVITIPDQRYEAYRRGVDWIQKHIFPGACLPSLTALSEAMTAHSRFVVEHLENIGVHYARTLRAWREALLERAHEVTRLGFDTAFVRKWEYYFGYCEAAFQHRALNDLQLVLTRPLNEVLSAVKGVA